MEFILEHVVFFACAVLSAVHSLPANQAPLLNELPEEVLFRVQEPPRPFELDCFVESGDTSNVQFTWNKDDKPLDVKSNSDLEQVQGKLIFKHPKDTDEGIYQCFGKTPNGMATTRRIRVKRTYIIIPELTLRYAKPVEGRPFQLQCRVPDGYPKPTIEWKRQSIADGKIEDIRNPRIFSPQGDLYFSNATLEDVSTDLKYVCFAKTPAVDQQVAVAEHIVEGLSAAPEPGDGEVVQQYVSPDLTARVGDVTEIYCVYGGNPMPYPDWWKDGVNVNNARGDRVTRYNRSKGKRLLIKETLPEDNGQYTCIIDNGVGKVKNHSVHLSVVSAPRFAKKPARRITAKAGQEISLPCETAKVGPASQPQWTRNAIPAADPRYDVNDQALTIVDANESDSGYYGCRIVNPLGEDYAETYLNVVA